MRFVIPVLFWVGLFGIVWEWRYARKHGLAITRAEKLYLALALPLILGVQLLLDLVGISATGLSALAIGLALNAWVIRRRISRASGS